MYDFKCLYIKYPKWNNFQIKRSVFVNPNSTACPDSRKYTEMNFKSNLSTKYRKWNAPPILLNNYPLHLSKIYKTAKQPR